MSIRTFCLVAAVALLSSFGAVAIDPELGRMVAALWLLPLGAFAAVEIHALRVARSGDRR